MRRIHCEDRSAEWDQMRNSLCGTLEARQSLLHGTPELYWARRWASAGFHNEEPAGLSAISTRYGWHCVQIPGQSLAFFVCIGRGGGAVLALFQVLVAVVGIWCHDVPSFGS